MLRTLVVTFALAAAHVSALAAERISDASYVAASRCAAYAELPQLASDGLDVTHLREALAVDRGTRANFLRDNAREAERRVRIEAQRSNNADLLRIRRDSTCAPFVARGLASRGAGAGGGMPEAAPLSNE
jgi:hypothetical protein